MVENAGMVGGCAVGLRSTMVVAAGRRQQPQRFVASGIIQFLVQLWESGIFVLKIFCCFFLVTCTSLLKAIWLVRNGTLVCSKPCMSDVIFVLV
jgi:hypothetical protein